MTSAAGRAIVLVTSFVGSAACTSGESDPALRVALWAGGHELEIERQVADRYEALHPGVRVVLESAPNGYEERLLTSIAAGRPPDVYLMDSPDIPTFVERGLALDLAPYREALGFRSDSVFGPVADAFRRGGSIFALPKDFTPMVLYANRAVLAAAGVEDLLPPGAAGGWTWTDFRRAAEGGGRRHGRRRPPGRVRVRLSAQPVPVGAVRVVGGGRHSRA